MEFVPKTETAMLRDMAAATAVRSALSDVTTSGSVFGLLRAVASELAEANLAIGAVLDLMSVLTAAGTDLDETASLIVPGLLRRGRARAAVGRVQLERPAPGGALTEHVPAGTSVLTDDGTVVLTTSVAVVTGTDTLSTEVSAVAAEVGPTGNLAVGAVTRISGSVGTFTSATNTTPFTGGRTRESDDDFKRRILTYVATLSRSTPSAMSGALLGVVDAVTGKEVKFLLVFEDQVDRGNVIIYIDDGAGTARETASPIAGEIVIASAVGGEEYLYLASGPVAEDETITITSSIRGALTLGTDVSLNPTTRRLYFTPALVAGESITGNYTPYSGLIAEVQRLVDGDARAPDSYPGLRAAGTVVRVRSSTASSFPVVMTITVDPSFDKTSLKTTADNETLLYINSLGIGQTYIHNELVQRIMDIQGIVDVNFLTPTGNLTPQPHEVFRITTNDVDVD